MEVLGTPRSYRGIKQRITTVCFAWHSMLAIAMLVLAGCSDDPSTSRDASDGSSDARAASGKPDFARMCRALPEVAAALWTDAFNGPPPEAENLGFDAWNRQPDTHLPPCSLRLDVINPQGPIRSVAFQADSTPLADLAPQCDSAEGSAGPAKVVGYCPYASGGFTQNDLLFVEIDGSQYALSVQDPGPPLTLAQMIKGLAVLVGADEDSVVVAPNAQEARDTARKGICALVPEQDLPSSVDDTTTFLAFDQTEFIANQDVPAEKCQVGTSSQTVVWAVSDPQPPSVVAAATNLLKMNRAPLDIGDIGGREGATSTDAGILFVKGDRLVSVAIVPGASPNRVQEELQLARAIAAAI